MSQEGRSKKGGIPDRQSIQNYVLTCANFNERTFGSLDTQQSGYSTEEDLNFCVRSPLPLEAERKSELPPSPAGPHNHVRQTGRKPPNPHTAAERETGPLLRQPLDGQCCQTNPNSPTAVFNLLAQFPPPPPPPLPGQFRKTFVIGSSLCQHGKPLCAV